MAPVEIVDLPSYEMVIFHQFFICLPEGNQGILFMAHLE